MTNPSPHFFKTFEWQSKAVGLELQNEIEQFYYREAQLLDHRAYEAWFALLEKDIRYFMPLRTNRTLRESKLEYSGDQDFAHFDETYETMYGRIRKVTSELGSDYIVQSFMTVVVGGVGNIWGTLAGALERARALRLHSTGACGRRGRAAALRWRRRG